MKFKKILIIILIILLSSISINAITTNGGKEYWTFDNTYYGDISAIDFTITGSPSFVSGKINDSISFNSSGDYIVTTSNPYDINTGDFSVSLWILADDITPSTSQGILSNRYYLAAQNGFMLINIVGTSGKILFGTRDTSFIGITSNSSINSGWNHIVVTRTGSSGQIYLNGVLDVEGTIKSGDLSINTNWAIGDHNGNNEFNGLVDEVYIVDYVMTAQNVSDLYNSDNGLQYPFTTLVPTPQIQTNLSEYYNSPNISIQLNTTSNVNMSYNLNESNYIPICNDCNNSVLNLSFPIELNYTFENPVKYITGLDRVLRADEITANQYCVEQGYTYSSEYFSNSTDLVVGYYDNSDDTWKRSIGIERDVISYLYCSINSSIDSNHTINFKSIDENGINYNNQSFVIDTIEPIINNSIPAEINNRNMSISPISLVSVTDINPYSCYINFSYGESCLCNATSFTFNYNGNYSYNITAIDKVGNNATDSGIILINPYQFIYFQDEDSNLISNFSFAGNDYEDYVNETIYNSIFSLGNNSYLFKKGGYVLQNFSVELTNQSLLNITLNSTRAKIIVYLFDRETGNVFNKLTQINILNLTNATTSTGNYTFDNLSFSAGNYNIEAISDGYYTARKEFIYSGESIVSVNLYLLNATSDNSASLLITVYDEFYNIIQTANVQLQEYDTSTLSYVEVSQSLSDSNGQVTFLIEEGIKNYKIIATKIISGVVYSTSTNEETFNPFFSGGLEITGQIYERDLFLKLSDDLSVPDLYGLIISAPETKNDTIINETSTELITYIPVNWTSINNLDYTICLTYYLYQNGDKSIYLTEFCDTGSSGTLPIVQRTLNKNYSYVAEVSVNYNNQTTIYKTYIYNNVNSFSNLLDDIGMKKPIIIFLWCVLIAACLLLENIVIFAIIGLVLSIGQGIIFNDVFVFGTSSLLTLILIGILYLARKKEELQ